MGAGVEHPGSRVENSPRIRVQPTTRFGWWAVGLAATSFALVLVGTVVPRGGAVAFASGLAGGVVAMTAMLREGERALTVFAALVPLVFGVAFVVAELIGGG